MKNNKIILFNPRSAKWKHRIPNSILQVGASIYGMYDFDFVDIFDTEPGLNFLTPYQLSGSLYTGDFLNRNNNPQGISHLSVWARDPADSSVVVSEPSTLGIIILAIFGGVISRLSRRRL